MLGDPARVLKQFKKDSGLSFVTLVMIGLFAVIQLLIGCYQDLLKGGRNEYFSMLSNFVGWLFLGM